MNIKRDGKNTSPLYNYPQFKISNTFQKLTMLCTGNQTGGTHCCITIELNIYIEYKS